MRVELPSGGWAEFRDTVLRGDLRDARKGMKFLINADGSRVTDGSFLDELTGRMISKMMIAWDRGTLPSAANTDELQQAILDGVDSDDYAALEKAVGPWVEKLLNRDRLPQFLHVQTGVRVELLKADDAARMAGMDGWKQVDEGAGPKPGSPPTAISSSRSPDPSGQTSDGTPPISTSPAATG